MWKDCKALPVIGFLILFLCQAGCASEPSWQTQWQENLGDGLARIQEVIPAIMNQGLTSEDEYIDGGWVILNEPDLSLARECELVEGDERPAKASEIAYVVVISPAIKKSVGDYQYQGSSGSVEKFVSRYEIKVIDWQKKHLVDIETVESPLNPGGIGMLGEWEEDQDKIRPSIAAWLAYRGVVNQNQTGRNPDFPGTAIQMASRNGDLRLVEYLIRKGFDVNKGYKGTPIHDALEQGQTEIAALLIQNGADTDFLVFAGVGDLENVKRMLSSDESVLDIVSDTGNTPLHYAAANGQTEVVSVLLSAGHVVNCKAFWDHEFGDMTPLHKAARYGYLDIVKILLENDAIVDSKTSGSQSGYTPYDLAARYGHTEVVEFLRKFAGE